VRRARRRALVALYLALGVVITAAALTSPVMAVKQMRLRGAEGLPAVEYAAVQNAVSLTAGTNWLRAPVHAVAQRLRAQPWVRDAQVTRRLPNAIEACITPRQPFLIAQIGARQYEIDADGVPIRRARPDVAGSLPFVVLDRTHAAQPGVPLNDDALTGTIEIIQFVRQAPRVRIAKIEVDQSDNICLNMQDSIPVLFGQTSDLSTKLKLLRDIYTREPDIALRVEAINLSSPDAPACTPRVAERTEAENIGANVPASAGFVAVSLLPFENGWLTPQPPGQKSPAASIQR
jgi:cell division septal protein FtsQ